MIADSKERKGKCYTKLDATEEEDRQQHIEDRQRLDKSKRPQRGEDPRQYREEGQRLCKTIGCRGGRIGDNTERKGRGYIQEAAKGGRIGNNTERKGGGVLAERCSRGVAQGCSKGV